MALGGRADSRTVNLRANSPPGRSIDVSDSGAHGGARKDLSGPRRPVTLKSRYENFIGGRFVPPVKGRYKLRWRVLLEANER